MFVLRQKFDAIVRSKQLKALTEREISKTVKHVMIFFSLVRQYVMMNSIEFYLELLYKSA